MAGPLGVAWAKAHVDFTVPVVVTTQPQTMREAAVLVVAVQTYDTHCPGAPMTHALEDQVMLSTLPTTP